MKRQRQSTRGAKQIVGAVTVSDTKPPKRQKGRG